MISFFGGLLIGLILMREWFALNTKIGNTRLMLHVIFTRETMTVEQLANGLKARGQLHYPALAICVWRMQMRGELEYDLKARTYRLKGSL